MTTQPIHYLHSFSADPNDWTEEWMRALGYIAYYFGQLEYASVWLADHLRTVVSNDGFSKRCDDACKRLVPTLSDDALRADWNAFFNTAKRCAKLRNDILHNPLEVDMQQILQHGIDETKGIILWQTTGRPRLSLHDVQAYVRDLVALHLTMLDLMKRTISI